jgi:hypothetical protein
MTRKTRAKKKATYGGRSSPARATALLPVVGLSTVAGTWVAGRCRAARRRRWRAAAAAAGLYRFIPC